MYQNQQPINKYRVFYVNGKTSVYNCETATMEKQFKENQEIEFYQEEILSNKKYA